MARVHINIEGFKRNPSGGRKVWQSDLKHTYCCEWWNPCYFVWEKNTRHNDYNGYNGYFPIKHIEVLPHV